MPTSRHQNFREEVNQLNQTMQPTLATFTFFAIVVAVVEADGGLEQGPAGAVGAGGGGRLPAPPVRLGRPLGTAAVGAPPQHVLPVTLDM